MPVYKFGNVFETDADFVFFTGNGVLTTTGNLVMGAGAARTARDKFPGLSNRLGTLVRGHKALTSNTYKYKLVLDTETAVGAFQTKYHWRDKSNLLLINESTQALVDFANQFPNKTIALNYPGIGYGGLTITVVEPLLALLPTNVHVYRFNKI